MTQDANNAQHWTAEEGKSFVHKTTKERFGWEIFLAEGDSIDNYYEEDMIAREVNLKKAIAEGRSFDDIEWELTDEEKLSEAKKAKLAAIDAYDKSSAVNTFTYSGMSLWFDKSTRVGLMNSTTILKNAGEEDTTLWLGDVHVTIPCDSVIAMLSRLERYALECYNVTARHKSEVGKLASLEAVESYDITEGYPSIPEF